MRNKKTTYTVRSANLKENEKKTKSDFFFTVNNSGKKVRFAPGNLFWDGKEFRFEKHQYDYPTEWKPDHVGHFFWSKDASKAIAPSYNDRKAQCNDIIFAADGGAIKGYTVLSKKEWDYLVDNAIAKKVVVIDSKKCLVLKPDGFSGTVADSYTADAWTTAEASGLVALPFAGIRFGSNFSDAGTNGGCWSSTPSGSGFAWNAYFLSDDTSTDYDIRIHGYSVRLVSVL